MKLTQTKFALFIFLAAQVFAVFPNLALANQMIGFLESGDPHVNDTEYGSCWQVEPGQEIKRNQFRSIMNAFSLNRINTKFLQSVSLFAANINGTESDPELFYNDTVQTFLDSNATAVLHHSGMNVTLSLLGNHQGAGWSCMDEDVVDSFASKIVEEIDKFGFDGVVIDDEYSDCTPDGPTLVHLAGAIQAQPKFKGKTLGKALFDDALQFEATYKGHKLVEYLNYGLEMTYGDTNYKNRLQPYVDYGMLKENLLLGMDPEIDEVAEAKKAAAFVEANGFGGMAIYTVSDLSIKSTGVFLSALAPNGTRVICNTSNAENAEPAVKKKHTKKNAMKRTRLYRLNSLSPVNLE